MQEGKLLPHSGVEPQNTFVIALELKGALLHQRKAAWLRSLRRISGGRAHSGCRRSRLVILVLTLTVIARALRGELMRDGSGALMRVRR